MPETLKKREGKKNKKVGRNGHNERWIFKNNQGLDHAQYASIQFVQGILLLLIPILLLGSPLWALAFK